MGGTGNVVKALEKLMVEEGIRIMKSSEVVEFITGENKITGVKLNNGELLNCNYIICNSDPPNVYKNLITGKKSTIFSLNKNKTNGLFYGFICLLFWI